MKTCSVHPLYTGQYLSVMGDLLSGKKGEVASGSWFTSVVESLKGLVSLKSFGEVSVQICMYL